MATDTLPRPKSVNDEPIARMNRLTVLYDDDCGVCRETIRQLRRWDREDRFEFLPLAQAASSGRPLLERLAAEGHLPDAIHVVDESTGSVVSGGHAALAILDALPGGWLLRPWAVLPPHGPGRGRGVPRRRSPSRPVGVADGDARRGQLSGSARGSPRPGQRRTLSRHVRLRRRLIDGRRSCGRVGRQRLIGVGQVRAVGPVFARQSPMPPAGPDV
jgi:predicted DCC family thiol-disulfide oxidoreductase YuxK